MIEGEFAACGLHARHWRGDGAGATTGAVIVNSSRAILYASGGADFADAARA